MTSRYLVKTSLSLAFLALVATQLQANTIWLVYFWAAFKSTFTPPVEEKYFKGCQPLFPPGTKIQAALRNSEVEVEFSDKWVRRYSLRKKNDPLWEHSTIRLYPTNRKGCSYNPGDSCENIGKFFRIEPTFIVDESLSDSKSIAELNRKLNEYLQNYDAVYTSNGLLVGSFNNTDFALVQFTVNGQPPVGLHNSKESAIILIGGSDRTVGEKKSNR